MEADLSQQTGDQHRPQQGASGNPGLRPAIAWLAQILFQAETLGGVAEQAARRRRSEEHTSELQSLRHLVCRLLLEKKKTNKGIIIWILGLWVIMGDEELRLSC